MRLPKIILIGAGNVGYHLGIAFSKNGIPVVQVFSRKKAKAKTLSDKIGCAYTTSISKLETDADIYIIAVKDDAIEIVAKSLQKIGINKGIVTHTSGSIPTSILAPYFEKYGSFYPLQTFSINKPVDFKKLPICIDGADKSIVRKLKQVAKKISPNIHEVDDEKRAMLHVAAVFVCNFANHLYQIGDELCTTNNLPFDILKPLIEETADKVQTIQPKKAQTGPAIRGDKKTIKKQMKYLQQFPRFKKVYSLLTKSINPDL